MSNDGAKEQLGWLYTWWRETENPLFAWEAIAWALGAEPPLPIPEWTHAYLHGVASNITNLAHGYCRNLRGAPPKDLVSRSRQELQGIKSELPTALELIVERKKNAFSRLRDTANDHRVALDQEWAPESGAPLTTAIPDENGGYWVTTAPRPKVEDVLAAKHSISTERARRRVSSARKLLTKGQG
jgi:hypothetical protein